MRIPLTINLNCLKAYETKTCQDLPNQLKSWDLRKWDCNIPKSLNYLCIAAVAGNWTENQILDELVLGTDRYLLLDLLPTTLPLELTVPKIPDDIYWKKCYLERWPVNSLRSVPEPADFKEPSSSRKSSNGQIELPKTAGNRTWKEHFLEKHISEYLELLKPEQYDAEKFKELSDLFGSFIRVLKINQLQASETSPNRIPLNTILSAFGNLTELELCFKQKYCSEFSWNIMKTSETDIKLLAKGLEKCRLKNFSLINSDIDGSKCIIILKSLLRHENLEKLNFSHCGISNKGCLGLAKFIMETSVKEINLSNNKIGRQGVEALSLALTVPNRLEILNLRLNNLSQAMDCLSTALTNINAKLKSLIISCCQLSSSESVEKIIATSFLESIDVSNNFFGKEQGLKILEAVQKNYLLIKMDIRMCGIASETEFLIQQKLVENKEKSKIRNYGSTNYNGQEFKEESDLWEQIENIFST